MPTCYVAAKCCAIHISTISSPHRISHSATYQETSVPEGSEVRSLGLGWTVGFAELFPLHCRHTLKYCSLTHGGIDVLNIWLFSDQLNLICSASHRNKVLLHVPVFLRLQCEHMLYSRGRREALILPRNTKWSVPYMEPKKAPQGSIGMHCEIGGWCIMIRQILKYLSKSQLLQPFNRCNPDSHFKAQSLTQNHHWNHSK